MSTKQDRINEVYAYVRKYFGVHTKTDFADRLHITQPAMSAAMNGKDSYLTKNLFMKVSAAFPGVFNLDYLLTGKGSLLNEEIIHDDGLIQITESIDSSSLINAALAAKDETIATLRDQIATLNELISGLRDEITILKSQSDRVNYHFPIGVADDHQRSIDGL